MDQCSVLHSNPGVLLTTGPVTPGTEAMMTPGCRQAAHAPNTRPHRLLCPVVGLETSIAALASSRACAHAPRRPGCTAAPRPCRCPQAGAGEHGRNRSGRRSESPASAGPTRLPTPGAAPPAACEQLHVAAELAACPRRGMHARTVPSLPQHPPCRAANPPAAAPRAARAPAAPDAHPLRARHRMPAYSCVGDGGHLLFTAASTVRLDRNAPGPGPMPWNAVRSASASCRDDGWGQEWHARSELECMDGTGCGWSHDPAGRGEGPTPATRTSHACPEHPTAVPSTPPHQRSSRARRALYQGH